MRAPILLALLTALALPSPALAGTRSLSLSYDELGFIQAAPERPAKGPERLAAGPDGLLALSDPIDGVIRVVSNMVPGAAFPVPRADGLAFTNEGLLVILDQPRHTVGLWSSTGQALDTAPVPDLVPAGGVLVVDDHEVLSEDIFGNRHRVATITGDTLTPPSSPSLLPAPHTIRTERGTVWVDDTPVDIEPALRTGARLLGERWLVVDRVVDDAPIAVERQAIDLKSGRTVSLPVQGRLYTPVQDLSVDPLGRLYFLDPRAEALVIVRVSP